jgi:hypothetical protein
MLATVRRKDQPSKFKVLSYGIFPFVNGEIQDAFKFEFFPQIGIDDTQIGIIPIGFSSAIPLENSQVIINTRESDGKAEFQMCFPDAENILCPWTDDIDTLWIETLQKLEVDENYSFTEETLDFLDADPLFLFGIADASTQQAIEKASSSSVPALRSIGETPTLAEWFSYMGADPEIDRNFAWVISSIADSELPVPWTSYKGIGSVICFLNSSTNETTWKHPYYDYFAQLLHHCRRSSPEDNIKLRVNRLIWSYETEANSSDFLQYPIVCPKYVALLAEIFSIDIVEEGLLVRHLKSFLKIFALQYRLEEEVSLQEVKLALNIIESERKSFHIIKENEIPDKLFCVECGLSAAMICVECNDCFCSSCDNILHSKGNRSSHNRNSFILCSLCKRKPASLQCTYSFGCFCYTCFHEKHAKSLPRFIDLKPVEIDYLKKLNVDLKDLTGEEYCEGGISKSAPANSSSECGWHPFFDMRGVKYFFNFKSQESVRRLHAEHIPQTDFNAKEQILKLAYSRDSKTRSAPVSGSYDN